MFFGIRSYCTHVPASRFNDDISIWVAPVFVKSNGNVAVVTTWCGWTGVFACRLWCPSKKYHWNRIHFLTLCLPLFIWSRSLSFVLSLLLYFSVFPTEGFFASRDASSSIWTQVRRFGCKLEQLLENRCTRVSNEGKYIQPDFFVYHSNRPFSKPREVQTRAKLLNRVICGLSDRLGSEKAERSQRSKRSNFFLCISFSLSSFFRSFIQFFAYSLLESVKWEQWCSTLASFAILERPLIRSKHNFKEEQIFSIEERVHLWVQWLRRRESWRSFEKKYSVERKCPSNAGLDS